MTDQLLLPLSSPNAPSHYPMADEDCSALISTWINSRVEQVRQIWSEPSKLKNENYSLNSFAIADEITTLLTHRIFNFQSKLKLSPILSGVRQNIIRQINNNKSIHFFLLYNGGYRASSFPDDLSLIFEPDQTELMLLYQITLLKQRVSEVYYPGIDFSIVINNGVAHWVNDIPLADTEGYADKLRRLINLMGAASNVSVLLQSELTVYKPYLSFTTVHSQQFLSEKEHRIVERFLGRKCSREEAAHRASQYTMAEVRWGQEIFAIAAEDEAIMLRQVAHPMMLSFRPFPGGAMRAQNGTFGFQYRDNVLKPKLITSESVKQHGVKWVPYIFPLLEAAKRINSIGTDDE